MSVEIDFAVHTREEQDSTSKIFRPQTSHAFVVAVFVLVLQAQFFHGAVIYGKREQTRFVAPSERVARTGFALNEEIRHFLNDLSNGDRGRPVLVEDIVLDQASAVVDIAVVDPSFEFQLEENRT